MDVVAMQSEFTFEVDAKLQVTITADGYEKACEVLDRILKDNKDKDGTLPVSLEVGWYQGYLKVAPVCGATVVNVNHRPLIVF